MRRAEPDAVVVMNTLLARHVRVVSRSAWSRGTDVRSFSSRD
jgi:hypothetical protein